MKSKARPTQRPAQTSLNLGLMGWVERPTFARELGDVRTSRWMELSQRALGALLERVEQLSGRAVLNLGPSVPPKNAGERAGQINEALRSHGGAAMITSAVLGWSADDLVGRLSPERAGEADFWLGTSKSGAVWFLRTHLELPSAELKSWNSSSLAKALNPLGVGKRVVPPASVPIVDQLSDLAQLRRCLESKPTEGAGAIVREQAELADWLASSLLDTSLLKI